MPLSHLLRLLAALLTLTTSAVVARMAWTEWSAYGRAGVAIESVAQLRLGLQAAEMVSRERGPANGVLGSASPTPPERLRALAEARERTDRSLDALGQVMAGQAHDAARQDAARRFLAGRLALREARAAVDRVATRPKAERSAGSLEGAVAGMVAVVPTLAPAIAMLANDAQKAYPPLGDAVQGARMIAELREHAGQLGSHFTAALTAERPFTADERAQIERTRGRIDELRFLASLRVQLPGQAATVMQAWMRAEAQYFQVAQHLVQQVLAVGDGDGRYGMDPAGFAARYVPEMNTLFGLRDELLAEAATMARAGQSHAGGELLLAAAAAGLLLSLLTLCLAVVQRRLLQPLAGTTQALEALARHDLDAPLPRPQADDEMAAVIGAVQTLQTQVRHRQTLERERDGLIERLRDLSNTDFLTGLPNRRAFFQAAQRDLAEARRHGHCTVLLLLDVDHFKQFNDTHGHAAGDQALVEVGQVIRRAPRLGDLVGRFGGEEFVLMLNHCDAEQGLRFAERLREGIAQMTLAGANGAPMRVTVSVGVTSTDCCGFDLQTLLSRADAAMYGAKRAGRNQVMQAEAVDAARATAV